ncbi:MAG TPA: DNA-3-methyladenine glycosylase [Kofleriaceae bacterium]|nr:DNA-3-methyladenine glycosylase [Kofleriaceae bacterium]
MTVLRLAEGDLARLRAHKLAPDFYRQDAIAVARGLLGCALVHGERAGVVVETEAYLGPHDLASHARFGPTARNRVMFGPGGVAYVYLCYGVHEMMNVVTGREGEAGAVLIRAVAPVSDVLADVLAGVPDDVAVGRGPGKVTRALAIDRTLTGRPLDGDELYVASWQEVPAEAIARGPRIGVAYAGAWAARRLRFAIAGHPSVSRPAPTGKDREAIAEARARARSSSGSSGASSSQAPRRR